MLHWKTARFRRSTRGGALARPHTRALAARRCPTRASAAAAATKLVLAERARTDRRLASRNLFLANLSHELRTPLNAIIGFAELLASGAVPDDSPRRGAFLGNILQSARHLLQLMNDVLELSRVEAGLLKIHPERVELANLVSRVVDVLHSRVVRKSLDVDIDVDPEVGTVIVDPAHLKRVLLTYLSNAVDHSLQGGRVTVRARREDGCRFRLEVEDHGAGLAPDALDRVFCQGLSADVGTASAPEQSGVSLGLARRLVRALGGEVGAHGTAGGGSTFFLLLGRVPTGHRMPAAATSARAPVES